MSATESHEHAARCLQVAEKTNSRKLKGILLAQAEAWLLLGEEQERIETRARERASRDEPPR
jgi:hypothetical protein